MATDTDHYHHRNQSYCGKNWSQSEMPSEVEHPRAMSISDILDHGSISFGRFAVDSLAWEKRSVFSHNRCQEELEKFKAPGFVAQKKAFFEDYYKRVRAMKALQAEQQQTSLPVSMSITTQDENAVDAELMKEEKKAFDVTDFESLENDPTGDLDSSGGAIVERSKEANKEESYCLYDDNAIAKITGGTCASLSAIETRHSVKEACYSSVNRISETAQDNSPVPQKAKHDDNDQKKRAQILKAKVTGSSTMNKTQLDCRVTKGVVEPLGNLKPSLDTNTTGKKDNTLVSSKRSTPKIAKYITSNYVSSRGKRTEVQSSATGLTNSLARDMRVTFPFSIGGQLKANSTSKGLLEKLPKKLPLQAQSPQGDIKETPINSGLRKKPLDNRRSGFSNTNKNCDADGRKPSEHSDRQMRPKGELSMNRRPHVINTMNLPAQNNLKQNYEVEFRHRSYVKGLQKKGDEKSDVGLGKEPKSASSKLSCVRKAPSPKPVAKTQDANLAEEVKLKGSRELFVAHSVSMDKRKRTYLQRICGFRKKIEKRHNFGSKKLRENGMREPEEGELKASETEIGILYKRVRKWNP